MIDYQRIKYKWLIVSAFNSQDLKTRFRLVDRWGMGRKRVLRGGRFMVGTPSPASHKYFSSYSSSPNHTPPYYVHPIKSENHYICIKRFKNET